MDVTIKLSFLDAVTLSAVMIMRKNRTCQDLEGFKRRGETPPDYLYDDLVEKTRLYEIIESAIEQALQKERTCSAALIGGETATE